MGHDQELKWLAFSLHPLSFFLYSPFKKTTILCMYLILLKSFTRRVKQILFHVHWTILNRNLTLKVVFLFHSFMGLIVCNTIDLSLNLVNDKDWKFWERLRASYIYFSFKGYMILSKFSFIYCRSHSLIHWITNIQCFYN